jgi:O-antigen/teichoic acid export membrane protein
MTATSHASPDPADRRFSRDVVWVLGSLVFAGLGGVAVNAFVVSARGPEALGVFNQAYAIYIVLSQLAVGGVQYSALQQVSYHAAHPEQCARICTSALGLVSAVSAIVCLAAFALRDALGGVLGSSGVGVAVAVMLPGLFLFSLNKVLLNVLNGLRHMRAYAALQSIRYVSLFAALALLVVSGRPDEQLTLSLSIAEAVVFIGASLYIRVRLFSFRLGADRWRLIKSHASYGARGFLSGVLSEMNTRVDILLLGYFRDDVTVGIYSFAAILAEGFAQIPLAVRANVDPIIGRHLAARQAEQIRAFSRSIRRRFFPMMLGLGALAAALYPVPLRLLQFDPVMTSGWPVFAILAAGIVLNARMRPFMGILLQAGRPGAHTFLIAVVVVSNAALNVALIPFLGASGAATATACAFLIEAAMIAWLARRLVGVAL